MKTVRPDEIETMVRIKAEVTVVPGETREMRRDVATRFDESGRHLERLNRLEERFDREIALWLGDNGQPASGGRTRVTRIRVITPNTRAERIGGRRCRKQPRWP